MLYVPIQFDKYESNGLPNTGAIQSALSEAELRKLLYANSEALLSELLTKFQSANRQR